jgi:hypothetical protein
MNELLIKNITEALKFKVSVSEIHDILKEKGFSESEILLSIKTGQIFLDHSTKCNKELSQNNLSFYRSE